MGGLLSGLFRTFGGGNPAAGTYGTAARPAGMGRKLATGALLAAGAAYLYNRNKNKGTSVPSFTPNL
ncbi:hypothetical protein CLV45_1445 [Hymenobacter chitinivorans DSM 11115]|uniref:Uncharacterized protein n=2 Tax=Hymenobacter chitinivorans TaxID=89969 RepID=A0A2M9BPY0_9BACT|nr:hypothetical protein CLV45_1445 [Hymenobacter chitinivorans DSM 11115]